MSLLSGWGQQAASSAPSSSTTPATTGGGLFGAASTTAGKSPSLLSTGTTLGGSGGTAAKPTLSLFGTSTSAPAATTATSQPATTTASGSTSLFGSSLFGGSTAATSQPSAPTGLSSLFGGSTAASGAGTAAATTTGTLGLSQGARPQTQQQQQPAAAAGGSNAYFDSLLARSARRARAPGIGTGTAAGRDDAGVGALPNDDELPQLQLGAGDLRERLRRLRSGGGAAGVGANGSPLGPAGRRGRDVHSTHGHYLLAGSGVDPAETFRDLNALDMGVGGAGGGARGAGVGVGRPRDAKGSVGGVPAGGVVPEVDVDTYLANMQQRTTMAMIADGLARSQRDFDDFLEDNLSMEWEAQRRRVYEHFGIKVGGGVAGGAAEEPSAAAAASTTAGPQFGRSRRSRTREASVIGGAGGTASTSTPGRASSAFGKSAAMRSLIGTPTRIGAHPTSDFADVDIGDGKPGAGKAAHAVDDRFQREKQKKLAEKVRQLNDARIQGRAFPIFSELASVENGSMDQQTETLVNAHRAMMAVVQEDAAAAADETAKVASRERQFARFYLESDTNPQSALRMKQRILAGANAFLERKWLGEAEALIAKQQREANLGGRPDVVSKIKAYVRLRAASKNLIPDGAQLQEVNGEYVWPIVFFLLRSGHVDEAARYVNDNANLFRSFDRTFGGYLNSYAASDDRRLKRGLQERCNNEYNQRLRNAPDGSVDPYRIMCYRVVGRCDLGSRSIEPLEQMLDIHDWLWLQFNLAREGDRAAELAHEAYGLADLQALVRDIGQKHFPRTPAEDDGTGQFAMYFLMQVLAGMYEQAVFYLYRFSYVDAVHFAIGLAYYGLLRVSDPLIAAAASQQQISLLSFTTRGHPQLSFGRMVGYYTRDFRAADVVSAVDYLALLCLNADLPGDAGRRQASLCHEALRELVLETREFSRLIGDVDARGRRVRGVIEERAPIIGLADDDDFVAALTLQAARFAEDNGRTTDAVLLYHLAGDYDAVVAIVARALGEAVSQDLGEDPVKLVPVKPRTDSAGNGEVPSTLSLAAIDDPVVLARAIMGMYERDAMFFKKIQEQNKIACRVLLQMSEIKGLVEQGQWAESLDVSYLPIPLPSHSSKPVRKVCSHS